MALLSRMQYGSAGEPVSLWSYKAIHVGGHKPGISAAVRKRKSELVLHTPFGIEM